MSSLETEDESKQVDVKVVILGSTGVGKTSMVNQYIRGQFVYPVAATIGASFMLKKLKIDDWTVTLQIWDTAGQERFRSMAPMYYRNAAAAILVFDVTSEDSLAKVKDWVQELHKHVSSDIVLALAGNKVDKLNGQKTPLLQQASQYAESIGARLFQTSAISGAGIEELFLHISTRLLKARTAMIPPRGTVHHPGPHHGTGSAYRGTGSPTFRVHEAKKASSCCS